jgi:hypothetical protein
MPESVPPNEGIVLCPDELIGLTGRMRRDAQARVPRCGAEPLPPLRPAVDARRVQQERTAKNSAGRSHVPRS